LSHAPSPQVLGFRMQREHIPKILPYKTQIIFINACPTFSPTPQYIKHESI
jgi:hypothetical protein